MVFNYGITSETGKMKKEISSRFLAINSKGQYVILQKRGKTVWYNNLRREDISRWNTLMISSMSYSKSVDDYCKEHGYILVDEY